MIFTDTPTQSEDGTYYVRATADDKKKVFVQLNRITVAEETDFEVNPASAKKIAAIDAACLSAAFEHAEAWFGKPMTEAQLTRAYQGSVDEDGVLSCDTIPPTKIFDADLEVVGLDGLTAGRTVNAIVEFAGLWFGRKTFGPVWNVVQVKMHALPIVDEYPSEYAFGDDDDEEEMQEDEPVEPQDEGEVTETETIADDA